MFCQPMFVEETRFKCFTGSIRESAKRNKENLPKRMMKKKI